MKRFTALILSILTIFCFTACEAEERINTDVTDSYIDALNEKDFAGAHDCFWSYGGSVSKETYVSDCEYIVSQLGVTEISAVNNGIVNENEKSYLKYTITLKTENAGDITQDCKAELVLENSQTYIVYKSDLILKDYEHGDVITRVSIKGERGEVFTADGKLIAQNSFADTVYIDVTQIEDFKTSIAMVDSILDLTEKQLSKIKTEYDTAVENNYGQVIVKAFSKGSLTEELAAQLTAIDGIKIDSESLTYQRFYPYSKEYSHLLGYANSPNEEQAEIIEKEGYSKASVWGKEGVEKAYNEEMLSKDGYAYQLRKDTYEIKYEIFRSEAQDGSDIYLTVNSKLQEAATALLDIELTEDQAGSVIVINAKTAEVLAQASGPAYDTNLFALGISEEDYSALLDDKNAPLFNRATQGLYPPGSTIKPFTGTAGIDNKVCSFNTVFPYPIVNNTWTPENWHWLPITRNEYVEAPIDMRKAMVHSDNIYFAWLGLEMGYQNLADYFTSIGIGKSVPYDLPTAKSNLINEDAEKNGTMTADMSFGHGQLLVTPLQLVSMYTAFENDGDILTPYVVSSQGSTVDGQYITEEIGERSVYIDNAVDSDYISGFNNMFEGVVEEGTAYSLSYMNGKVLAKTGTAIKGDDKDKRISWLVAWMPESEDSRMVCVVIETPANMHNVKFDIAKQLLLCD